VLVVGTKEDQERRARLIGLRQGLESGGWIEGQNLQTMYRYSGSALSEMQGHAKDLVSAQPDVIVTAGSGPSAAAQAATRTIPIIFLAVSDPIGSGFVASLARPGGNMTGMLNTEASIVGKWMTMLKEVNPRLTRAALLGNPKTTPFDYFEREAQTSAQTLAIEVVPVKIENRADIERAVTAFAQQDNGGLLVPPDQTLTANRAAIVALAAQHRLPVAYNDRVYVEAGGLMSYGSDYVQMYRQGGLYVDRVLRGEKPSDLPVQAPIRYATVINLKTAKALGFAVTPTLLARADEVIE
jgi:putative ABC transport system substrate-binding protein